MDYFVYSQGKETQMFRGYRIFAQITEDEFYRIINYVNKKIFKTSGYKKIINSLNDFTNKDTKK